MSGKWHVRRDVGSLFDVVRNPRPGMPDVFPDRTPEAYDRPFEGEEDPWSPWDERLGGYWEGGTHWSEALASDALEFIEEASGRSEPFFMYLAFNAPHNHSLRVPLIVVGPEAEAGATIEAPVYLQDVMPTTLDLAGAAGHEVDFRSLLPLIRRESAPPYAAIYGAYLDLQRCVVEGRHKLVLYPAVGRMRLFDLESDPHEVRDLSENPEFRPVIGQLLHRLIELQAQMGDELDLAEAFPDWF